MARATEITRYDDQRPDPADEAFHAVGHDPTWSESFYFYYFDPKREVGGYTRLGFRPHDGWRDAVHMLYLEGDRIGFCYEREAHAAAEVTPVVGATRLSMEEAFGSWRLDFDGSAEDCTDGRVIVAPRKERPEGWAAARRAGLALDYRGVGAPFYTARAGGGGHFEHFATVRGELKVGEAVRPLDGYGLRDKSWGPRPWTNQTGAAERAEPDDSPFGRGPGFRVYGAWLTVAFGADLGFAVGASPTADGGMRAQGFLMKDGANHQITDLELETDYAGETLFQQTLRFAARFDDGTTLEGRGEVLNNGPSKIPHGEGRATIVNASMTRFVLDSGARGVGITEYHSSVSRKG